MCKYTVEVDSPSDYSKYRSKCKEMSRQYMIDNPELNLRLVRGHYHPLNSRPEQHWWLEDSTGKIIDITARQFPCKGCGDYIEFSGFVSCEECKKEIPEEDAQFVGRYVICSYRCYGKLVGLGI